MAGEGGDGMTAPIDDEVASTDGQVNPGTSVAPVEKRRIGVYLVAVGAVIMLAGLLFGYDQGVISGALGGIQKQFSVGHAAARGDHQLGHPGRHGRSLVAGGLADRSGGG